MILCELTPQIHVKMCTDWTYFNTFQATRSHHFSAIEPKVLNYSMVLTYLKGANPNVKGYCVVIVMLLFIYGGLFC